jgi:hypothetical protein
MPGKNKCILLFGLIFTFIIYGCKSKPEISGSDTVLDSLISPDSLLLESNNTHIAKTSLLPNEISADTIWLKSYPTLFFLDTIVKPDYSVNIQVRVDTNDYIIDTINSMKGVRIVIGYNHLYQLEFIRNEKFWFTQNFSKKADLAVLLDGTDLWLESNLNLFENLHVNNTYAQVVMEMNISSPSSFGLLFYFILSPEDGIIHRGAANSWGGGTPDGTPFITSNEELYVNCSEVYNFRTSSATSLSEYVSLSVLRTSHIVLSELIQIHALRNLSNNCFLVIFNRFHDEPVYNAFVLSTDSMLLSRFSYYGIIEEMEAILLYSEVDELNRSFLYDIGRERLICITHSKNPKVYELSTKDMLKYNSDSTFENFELLDFNLYGSYEFYFSPTDTTIYYRDDKYK